MAVAFLPMTLLMTAMEAAFVAGPANKKTRTAPGETPFNRKAAAMGVDDVAHTYKGVAMINISAIERY